MRLNDEIDSIVSPARRQALPGEHRDSGERGTTGHAESQCCTRNSELLCKPFTFLPPQSASQPAPPKGSLFSIDSNASPARRKALLDRRAPQSGGRTNKSKRWSSLTTEIKKHDKPCQLTQKSAMTVGRLSLGRAPRMR